MEGVTLPRGSKPVQLGPLDANHWLVRGGHVCETCAKPWKPGDVGAMVPTEHRHLGDVEAEVLCSSCARKSQ